MFESILKNYMVMRSSTGRKEVVYCVGAYSFARCLSMYLAELDPFQNKSRSCF